MGKVNNSVADIAIVGGGIVGQTVAKVLALHLGNDLRIVQISPDAVSGQGHGGKSGIKRAIALARGSIFLLDAIGVWSDLLPHAQAMRRIVVSDGMPGASQLSLLEFDSSDADGLTSFVVEEECVLNACTRVVLSDPHIQLIQDYVSAMSCTPSWRTLALGSGGSVRARLVIGCDGVRSPTRKMAHIKDVSWNYRQSALVAKVCHEHEHHGVAIERFLPAGPFAILPLQGCYSSLVWTESRQRAEELKCVTSSELACALDERWDVKRGDIVSIDGVGTFPLAFYMARRFIAERFVLIGDSAHQVHPLAGQGLNLGLRDVAAFCEVLVDTLRLGLDPATPGALEKYERWRRFDNISSALVFDGLNRLFSNEGEGLRMVRDLGLGAVDRLPAIKKMLMGEAQGLTGAVPKLMMGQTLV
jgi:2-octaprenyl-6-methoxyphenol hydroxylase